MKLGAHTAACLGLLGGSGIALFGILAACLDTTPITLAPTAASIDSGVDAPEAAAPCVACLESRNEAGPSCPSALAACALYPACEKSYECVREQGCFSLGSAEAIEVCGLPCAQKAGILSTSSDPAFKAALSIFMCAAGACGPACVERDAGH